MDDLFPLPPACPPKSDSDGRRRAHIRTGQKGEDSAGRFLERIGYRIIGRNVRVGKRDEIDLIAYDSRDRVLVFCEVKTRSKDDSEYHPEINLTWQKRCNMARAARRWVDLHAWEGAYRMDTLYVSGTWVMDHHIDVQWPKGRN